MAGMSMRLTVGQPQLSPEHTPAILPQELLVSILDSRQACNNQTQMLLPQYFRDRLPYDHHHDMLGDVSYFSIHHSSVSLMETQGV